MLLIGNKSLRAMILKWLILNSIRLYHDNKPWLTASLKESIRVKNKLYKNRNKGSNHEEPLAHYKRYRNKLNHILRVAERKHFKDQILEHKANFKKSWQIIKMVINKQKDKGPCAEFKYNGKTIKDGVEISNRFNNFFCKCWINTSKCYSSIYKKPNWLY